MTSKEFNKLVERDIKALIAKGKPTTMVQFLNKHATGNNSVLGYWFNGELEELTDAEILNKCIWLEQTKLDILNLMLEADVVDAFLEDYAFLANALGYQISWTRGCVWKD